MIRRPSPHGNIPAPTARSKRHAGAGGAGLFLLLTWAVLLSFATTSPARAEETCLTCHQGIERISKHHPFSCSRCHHGDPLARRKKKAHRGLVPNPSSLDHAPETCGPCHREAVRRVQRSLMATAAGVINQTRFAFGAQPDPAPRYATAQVASLRRIPLPPPKGKENLVDDLLRRRCLRCHLRTDGARRTGDFRARGCASCHVLYADDGRSRSGDAALAALPATGMGRPRPIRHTFTTRIPSSQCLHCHNGNRVGADYTGAFERDYHQAYRFDSKDGRSFHPIHGLDHHRLPPDVHFEKGLHCIDCHVQAEVMGDGKIHGSAFQARKVTCTDCHGSPRHMPPTRPAPPSALRTARMNPAYTLTPKERIAVTRSGEPLPNVIEQNGRLVLISKVTGKPHPIPGIRDLRPEPLDHRVPEHMQRMACSSCHAAWSFLDYGLHLFREDVPRYEKWRALWAQNDPQVQRLLQRALSLPVNRRPVPTSRDWINEESHRGIWYAGWSFRRWEGRILGMDSTGRVRMFRPQYQYVVTWVDREGRVRWDSRIPRTADGKPALVWNPYAPHTIRRRVSGCEACHGNAEAAGLGWIQWMEEKGRLRPVPLTRPRSDGLPLDFQLNQLVDLSGRPLQTTTHAGARPFRQEELRSLLVPSLRYRKLRLQDLGYRSPDPRSRPR